MSYNFLQKKSPFFDGKSVDALPEKSTEKFNKAKSSWTMLEVRPSYYSNAVYHHTPGKFPGNAKNSWITLKFRASHYSNAVFHPKPEKLSFPSQAWEIARKWNFWMSYLNSSPYIMHSQLPTDFFKFPSIWLNTVSTRVLGPIQSFWIHYDWTLSASD